MQSLSEKRMGMEEGMEKKKMMMKKTEKEKEQKQRRLCPRNQESFMMKTLSGLKPILQRSNAIAIRIKVSPRTDEQ